MSRDQRPDQMPRQDEFQPGIPGENKREQYIIRYIAIPEPYQSNVRQSEQNQEEHDKRETEYMTQRDQENSHKMRIISYRRGGRKKKEQWGESIVTDNARRETSHKDSNLRERG